MKGWGWDDHFEALWKQHITLEGMAPARVIAEHRDLYIVGTREGVLPARLSGKYRFETTLRSDFPTVGDWVALEVPPQSEQGVIHDLLPRRSKFSRKVPGRKTEEQVVAANVDKVFLVMGLDGDFNLHRLERYLVLSYSSGAQPHVVLTKADLHDDCEPFVSQVESIAIGLPVIVTSNKTGAGFDVLNRHLTPEYTIALLGSSGVGKSSMINRLLGVELQAVNNVREDDSKGRHTTTHRQLFRLPNGCLVIDNPGMRELQLWDSEGLKDVFSEINVLGQSCRFSDCRHETEPGCAVRQALEDGRLPEDRFQAYLKLKKEEAYLERKVDARAMQEHKKHWKNISKIGKEMSRRKRDY